MSEVKRKRNIWRRLLVIEIIVLILTGLTAFYVSVLGKTPIAQFVSGMLSSADGGDSIMSRRTDNAKPYPLTSGEKYFKTLVDPDSINVLILGESGVCYDTLLVASLDEKNNTVKLINIPRDIYIKYSNDVTKRLKKALPDYDSIKGMFKINAAHTVGKDIGYMKGSGRFGNPEYDFTADLVEEVFGIHIDDYIYLKASSISKVVDFFGGVDINVPYRMKYDDPTQNLHINLEKGSQHLDGKQAEGFIRFREGYDKNGKFFGIGDIERKKNQVSFVQAFIKQKATIGNIGRIITIANQLDEYLVSSIDNAQETAQYGKVVEKLYNNKFTTSSEEVQCSEKNIDGVYYYALKTAE